MPGVGECGEKGCPVRQPPSSNDFLVRLHQAFTSAVRLVYRASVWLWFADSLPALTLLLTRSPLVTVWL